MKGTIYARGSSTHKYNLMFIVDDKYNDVLPTVLNNISCVSSDIVENLEFNISYFGDEKSSEDLLRSLSPLNLNIRLKNIPSEFVGLTDLLEYHYSKTTHKPHISTASVYYRFFLASTWPELNGKLLYLDTDILVRESLSKLFGLIPNQNEYPLLSPAVKFKLTEAPHTHRTKILRRNIERILTESEKLKIKFEEANLTITPLDRKKPVFNGGVWFYDLDIIRGGSYEDKMRVCMEIQSKWRGKSKNKIFYHNDQGIMNFVFRNFYHLPSEWNSLHFGHNSEPPTVPFESSKIVHFNGPWKPWLKDIPDYIIETPAFSEWNKYKLKSNEGI